MKTAKIISIDNSIHRRFKHLTSVYVTIQIGKKLYSGLLMPDKKLTERYNSVQTLKPIIFKINQKGGKS